MFESCALRIDERVRDSSRSLRLVEDEIKEFDNDIAELDAEIIAIAAKRDRLLAQRTVLHAAAALLSDDLSRGHTFATMSDYEKLGRSACRQRS